MISVSEFNSEQKQDFKRIISDFGGPTSTAYVLSVLDFVSSGFRDILVVDHVLTMKAGGLNYIENFQTLCETCNKRKSREDKAATVAAWRLM